MQYNNRFRNLRIPLEFAMHFGADHILDPRNDDIVKETGKLTVEKVSISSLTAQVWLWV